MSAAATPVIRLAARDDVPAVLAIANRAAAETAANFAVEPETLDAWDGAFLETHERFPWLVAGDDAGAVVAFARASPHRGRCAYAYSAEVTVYVLPEHHGRGLGRALYGRLIPLLAAQGFVTLLAGIALPNPASVRLHESFGFRPVGVYERVGWKFGRWHDVGYWQLALRDDDAAPVALRPVRESESGS